MIHLISRNARELFGHHDQVEDLVEHAARIVKACGQTFDAEVFLDKVEEALFMEHRTLGSTTGLCFAEKMIRSQWIDKQVRVAIEMRHGLQIAATH
jgi:hypothetical protein